MSQEKRFHTPKGRLSFPFLFTPRPKDAKKPDGKPSYELSLIFDAEAQKTPEFQAIAAEAKSLALAKFGIDAMVDKTGKVVPKNTPGALLKRIVPPGVKNPIKKGDEKISNTTGEPLAGYDAGTLYFSAKCQRAPGLVDGNNQKITDESALYPGCYVRASVTVYTYDRPDSKGVAFGLRNVQKMAEGEPLGGGGDPAADFDAVPGYASSATSGAAADFGSAQTADDGGVPF